MYSKSNLQQQREQFEGITPAYHMNKTHWSDLYLERLDDNFVMHQIQASYNLVVSKLQERIRETFEQIKNRMIWK
ncbi:MmcQ/YjbR family DNA-binding protein [Alloprevotella tannerae]|uniref:MmcQ/YjbR family DNA-binding protein n=1 Tax=Alloprevotella tannerae TaxID=76122 RepID=UPI00396587B3